MSEFDIDTVSTTPPADAPTPTRGKKTVASVTAPLAAPPPVKVAKDGFALHVFTGTADPVVLTFDTKEAREKSIQQLTQRVNRLPTPIRCGGKVYTFIYVTHFISEE